MNKTQQINKETLSFIEKIFVDETYKVRVDTLEVEKSPDTDSITAELLKQASRWIPCWKVVNGETIQALLVWAHHPIQQHSKKHPARETGPPDKNWLDNVQEWP